MSENVNKLPKMLGQILIAIAASLYLLDIIYLFLPDMFAAAGENIGLVLYGLATAGAAFAAWGMILKEYGPEGVSSQQIMKASAAGFILLGFMRLVTAFMPPPPFDSLMPLLIGEFILFTGLGVKLYRS